MAYVYQVSFTIGTDQMDELRIGSSMERVLGYLRTLLPSQTGFQTSRSMYSVDRPKENPLNLVFESVWETWENLEAHRESSLSEEKVLVEFGPHIEKDDLAIHIFHEVD